MIFYTYNIKHSLPKNCSSKLPVGSSKVGKKHNASFKPSLRKERKLFLWISTKSGNNEIDKLNMNDNIKYWKMFSSDKQLMYNL